MEKKNTIWVVVTWDNDAAKLTSKQRFLTRDAAEAEVLCWYMQTMNEYEDASGQRDSDNLYACVWHGGLYENCEAFEVEL